MHIVLYEPDIPWNTGNVGRTCVATGTTLHLVGRLGFSVDDKEIRRAGLDYWSKVDLKQHDSWEAFVKTLPENPELFFFSKKATKNFWHASFTSESYLIFGCETKGLPNDLFAQYTS